MDTFSARRVVYHILYTIFRMTENNPIACLRNSNSEVTRTNYARRVPPCNDSSLPPGRRSEGG